MSLCQLPTSVRKGVLKFKNGKNYKNLFEKHKLRLECAVGKKDAILRQRVYLRTESLN